MDRVLILLRKCKEIENIKELKENISPSALEENLKLTTNSG